MMIRPSVIRSSSTSFRKILHRFSPAGSAVAAKRAFLESTASSGSSALSQPTFNPLSVSQQRSFSDHAPAKTSKDGVVGRPIDFDVNSKIEGNESQIVTIQLEPGQVLRAESGAMMYMTNGVQMNTTTGGGLSEGFRRMMTGQNFFISDYTYEGEPGTTGTVALGTDFPSKIVRLNVEEYGGKLVCQKGALLYVDVNLQNADGG